MDYQEISNLTSIYLEESYVLDIIELKDAIIFNLNAVLTDTHELYHPPDINEQFCYRKAVLSFTGIESIHWLKKEMVKSIDANDIIDYGNIDYFTINSGICELGGDWGELELRCKQIQFEIKME